MKSIITLLLLGISISTFSQTKKETEDWISEKIELYSYSNEYDIFNSYIITYDEDNMIVKNNFKSITNGYETKFTLSYSIPIKEMSKIRFEEKGSNVWLILKIKGGAKSIKKSVDTESGYNYTNEIEIILEKSINDDNLKNRLTKAFNHLVKVHGGKVIEEKF